MVEGKKVGIYIGNQWLIIHDKETLEWDDFSP